MTVQSVPPAPWILAIDTGTSEIVVAGGNLDGSVILVIRQPAGYRHGELLLSTVERLLAETGLRREHLRGIVVGTGPGAFTGLRVGLATAKTLAHALGLPIVGVSTASALIHAAAAIRAAPDRPASDIVLLVPAGPRDRVIVRDGEAPRLLVDAAELVQVDAAALVAVDLDGRAPEDAVAWGTAARQCLGAAVLEIGAERLHMNLLDDPELLVPDYVTLPRGIRATTGAIEWSHDPR